MTSTPRILHCHSTFAAAGAGARSASLINALGKGLSHHVVSADPERMEARALIDRRKSEVGYPADFPSLTGRPAPGKLIAIAQALKPYDLILSYGWGAMNVAMAHTVFAQQLGLPPLIHHEDGFDAGAVQELSFRRNWYRRIALGRAHSLVVPGETLEKIAVDVWKQPRQRVVRVPPGIDTKAFARKPDPGKLRLVKREGEVWIGTLSDLGANEQLPRLVEAVPDLPENCHLVILGEGPEKEAIQDAAVGREVSHRVHLLGAIDDPSKVIGLFDIFAQALTTEQFPLAVVKAMAAGLPIVAPDVGDIKGILGERNREFITATGGAEALAAMLGEFARDPDLAKRIGRENREKARKLFDISRMAERYADLYSGALDGAWKGPR
ncbi:glycosyltransferase family 4 protein [Erythrobacter rubeus]|uniref:Glycosyltransferase family 4 protein n=1 Tax=Erythrobacter rubeus TaxID=2760803 RepID=A0ABR8KVM2_9SPHN|nr:glycosyltransferase family 4 protein [Erythrobacter rubeus]MBD2842276.1 glycosyltransferase family 4 protein [Erythrobacter rubeus]